MPGSCSGSNEKPLFNDITVLFLCFALLMQTGLGLNPFLAGTIFAPCSAGFVLASLAAPKLVARWGTSALVVSALIYAVFIAALIAEVKMTGAEREPIRLIPALNNMRGRRPKQPSACRPTDVVVLGKRDEKNPQRYGGLIQ
ncbi:hypothetical protein [Raoultella terrigena]|uniref:hypothetical protein n=1 Tax=Raoultella terrigena TaxID=577 RepID=UPI003F5D5531